MAQVATSTLADPLAPPSAGVIVRDHNNGRLLTIVQTAANTLTVYTSTNAGASWAAGAAFTHTGLAEWSSLVVDAGSDVHIAYRVSTTGGGGTDTIWYRRLEFTGTLSWSAAVQTSSNDSNGGVAGATWQGVDLAAFRNPNGSRAIVVAAARTLGTTRYGVQVMGVSITAPDNSQAGIGGGGATTIYLNNGIIQGTRAWWASGTAPGRSGVSCEIEHNGNGVSAGQPNVWITWGRQRLELVKLSWIGSASGWTGPTSSVVLRSGLTVAQDYPIARWDGNQYVTAIPSPTDSTVLRIYQRNRANTSTTTYDSPAHPQGVIRYVALSYDASTRNPRLYAIGTGNSQIYWIDYTRATGTWGTWTNLNAVTVLGPQEFGVRRGGTSGTARHDIVYAVTGSPNTIQHVQQVAVNTLPSNPTWNYTTTPPNGQAADVAAGLPLAWNFIDPDPLQTQGAYALRRQIGAGAIQYWNASTVTWGASEVFNASATPGVTLAAPWGADADAVHSYAVRVQDSLGGNSPGYSDVLALTPSAKSNPTITAPTAAQVLTSDTVTVSWTVADQTAYRIQLTDTTGTSFVAYDSGKQISTATSVAVPFSLPNATGYTLTLWTYNTEGLASTAQTRNFTVAYATPPGILVTATPDPARGYVLASSSSLAPVGTQPAIASQELWRRNRVNGTSLLPTGGAFNGSTFGFTSQAGTLTYSTAQSHTAPGSARLVPTGASPDSQVISSSVVPIPAATLAGGSLTVSGWIRLDTANKPIRVQINWLDGTGAYVGQAGTTITSVVAGAWMYVEFSAGPGGVPGAVRAAAVIGLTSTPAVGDAFYVDDVDLVMTNPSPGSRIGQLLGPGASFIDTGAPGNTDLEYRWVAVGANGTKLPGPWTG